MRIFMRVTKTIFLHIILDLSIISCAENIKGEKKKLIKASVPKKITALPKIVKAPLDNPASVEKEILGKLLFFDPILSGNKDVACATCHHPKNGYTEFLDLSIGPNAMGVGSKRKFNVPNDIPFVKRNAQTIINTAFNGIDENNRYDAETAAMFWDKRIESLEKQALEPIKAFEEMRGHGITEIEILQNVIDRLNDIPEYQKLFELAFGEKDAITVENLGKAIATFERTLISNNSRFDQYKRGKHDAITISEKEGMELFKSVGCINCHNGPMFSDYQLHVIGTPENNRLPIPDAGVEDTFAFQTPSLRNRRFTAPYMHNGSFQNLRRVLEFYEDISNGKIRNKNVSTKRYDPFVRELELSVKEMSLIISFLNTLKDDSFDKEIPESVPSGLQVGGDIQ